MKKGTFCKALGMVGVLVTLWVIIMLAMSPPKEGLCPEMLTWDDDMVEQTQPESVPVRIPETVSDSLPASAEKPVSDTFIVK